VLVNETWGFLFPRSPRRYGVQRPLSSLGPSLQPLCLLQDFYLTPPAAHTTLAGHAHLTPSWKHRLNTIVGDPLPAYAGS